MCFVLPGPRVTGYYLTHRFALPEDPVRSTSKLVGKMCLVLIPLGSSACANVAAYERGKLAHPTMSPSDATSAAREHVYAIQEGAMGGGLGVASGCGCN